MASNTEWLDGDLHCHCERHELIEELLEGVAERLDFLALTNHAQKPVFLEQPEMIARARALLPDTPIFFGMEWNGPGGKHINVIFPPSPREAEHATAFARAHDHRLPGTDSRIEPAMATLSALPAGERPIVLFNHPAARPEVLREQLDTFLDVTGPDLFVGIEALHGHQAWAHVAQSDPLDYPGSRIGGLCDDAYARGRPFAMLAHSDFHVHKQAHSPDYPLGIFNRTRVASEAGVRDAAAIFSALRAGRTCATQGRWLELRHFAIGDKSIGERWNGEPGRDAVLEIEIEVAEPVAALDVIGTCARGQAPRIVRSIGQQPEGRVQFHVPLPADADGFVRLRAVAADQTRPPPGPPAPRLFLSSAILLGSPARPGTSR